MVVQAASILHQLPCLPLPTDEFSTFLLLGSEGASAAGSGTDAVGPPPTFERLPLFHQEEGAGGSWADACIAAGAGSPGLCKEQAPLCGLVRLLAPARQKVQNGLHSSHQRKCVLLTFHGVQLILAR